MRQPHKMVKHTQTIRRQQPANCLSVFVHFVGLALKGLSRRVNNPMKSRFLFTLQNGVCRICVIIAYIIAFYLIFDHI